MFVSWCAMVAGVGTDIVPKHAYTPSGLNWFKSRGQAYSRATVAAGGYTPQPGDIIYFKSPRNSNPTNHVGIVTSYSNGMVYTVEGNTSSATVSTDGGAVAAKSYSIKNTYIVYICSPNYPSGSVSSAAEAAINPTYYADKYPDLKKAYGTDKDILVAHFITTGLVAGDQASPIFSVQHYLEKNSDLKAAFGSDYGAAYKHYLENGYKEIRDTAPYADLGADFYAKIKCTNSNLIVSISSASGDVLTYHETDSDAQWWHFVRQGDGAYKIINKKTGKCLDVDAGSYSSGSKVQLWDDNGSDAQHWYLHEVSSGKYVFRPKCAASCVLDIPGGSTEEGTLLKTYTCNSSAAQQFTIFKEAASTTPTTPTPSTPSTPPSTPTTPPTDNDTNLDNDTNPDNDVNLDNDTNPDNDVNLDNDTNLDNDVNLDNDTNLDNDVNLDNDTNLDNDVSLDNDTNLDNDNTVDTGDVEDTEAENETGSEDTAVPGEDESETIDLITPNISAGCSGLVSASSAVVAISLAAVGMMVVRKKKED